MIATRSIMGRSKLWLRAHAALAAKPALIRNSRRPIIWLPHNCRTLRLKLLSKVHRLALDADQRRSATALLEYDSSCAAGTQYSAGETSDTCQRPAARR